MVAMRRALERIIGQRKDDRLAVVVFSEHGYVVSPPTRDHQHLVHYLDMIEPDLLRGEGRTAIGEGVATAMSLFDSSDATETPRPGGRVVLVFTDGENNYGRDPIETVREARRRGYRVYLVGIDLPQGFNRRESLDALAAAVASTGGRYFDASSERELRLASDAIARVEKGVFAERTVEHDVPIFRYFVIAALGVLFAGLALKATPHFVEIT
jgi:Ca-activated chloride channel family protein